jgi:CRP-like cAMP-binding protein
MIEQVTASVREHILLSSLPAPAFNELMSHCRVVNLSNNESLFHQGSKVHSFYIVLSGKVKLYRVSFDGQTKIIEVINPGDAFAEALMFLEKSTFPLTAAGMEPSKVLQIPCQYYKEILFAAPNCTINLLGAMALKLHRRIQEIELLTLQNTKHRITHYLMNLVSDLNVKEHELELPIAKQLIASQLGMKPETFSRLFKEMKRRDILSSKGSKIFIHDLDKLRNFGYC